MRFAFLALAAFLSAPALAQPLTIPSGETRIFTLAHGQPANARKADAKARPGRGEIKVFVLTMMGTTMTEALVKGTCRPQATRAAAGSLNRPPHTK